MWLILIRGHCQWVIILCKYILPGNFLMITICRFSLVSSTGPEMSKNGDIYTLFLIGQRWRKLNCISSFTSLRKHSFSYTTGHNFFLRLTIYLLWSPCTWVKNVMLIQTWNLQIPLYSTTCRYTVYLSFTVFIFIRKLHPQPTTSTDMNPS